MLPKLHELTVDGGLPRSVDGRDFQAEAARLFDQARQSSRLTVALLTGRSDDARPHERSVGGVPDEWRAPYAGAFPRFHRCACANVTLVVAGCGCDQGLDRRRM